MNERIRELAKQAGWGQSTDLYARRAFDVNLFAALIISDCIDCASWVGESNKNPVEPVHTTQAVKKRIKQHFATE